MDPLPVRRYASAGGVVFCRASGHVLVLLRDGRFGPDGRLEVRLPKGHIEPGEESQQTALREVREEAGISGLEVVVCLGREPVEFEWRGFHHIRDETYYLLVTTGDTTYEAPEQQFTRQWLDWDQALLTLSFEAEREWVRRAQRAWEGWLEHIADQEPNETYQHTEME